jgi:two-component system sensor histidine kinase CpxA
LRPRFPLASRILLLALGNLMLIGIAFLIFLRLELTQDFGHFLMTAGRDKARFIAQQLSVELNGQDQSEWSQVLQRYADANGVDLMIYDNRGIRVAGPAIDPPPEVKVRLHPKTRLADGPLAAASWLPPFIVIGSRPLPYWLGVWLPIGQENVTRESPSRWELVLASPTLLTNSFFFPLRPWLAIGTIALAITLLCWLPMIIVLTRSIKQMMSVTARIAEGQFDVHVGATRKDELGHLGASINRMADRLDMFARGRNRFLGDVAHELRSPLGRMQAALGILEHGRLSSASYESTIADLCEEVETMSALTEELLTFARSKLVPEALELVPANLSAIVSRVIKAERMAGTTIRSEIDTSLYVRAEPEYLFRSVANTIRNAVRYAGRDGEIRVMAETRGELIILSVSDSGPGIPEESLDRIFTPFYRPDPSRDRRSGGTGLGLSIVRGCIEACQGSVACRNRAPTGLEVTMTLHAADPVL